MRFGELWDRVARGEEIVITRHDKPVAHLRALRQEIARNKGFKPLTDKEIRDAMNEGRR
ncbi:MAG: type II toxin-antitoxin system prevent-host-death family antitoxin [Bryobacteraceae bacterium]